MLTGVVRTRHRGAAAVEFAVVSPVLVLFVLGIIEIGRLVMVSQVVTNATREGARYSVLTDTSVSDVDVYVRQYLSQVSISESAIASIQLDYQTTTTDSFGRVTTNWQPVTSLQSLPNGTPIRLTLAVWFDQVSWLPTRVIVGSGYKIQGVCVMRKEGSTS